MGFSQIDSRAAPGINLDPVGVWWLVWTLVWTTILIAGMAFLWTRRHMPLLRVRGLPLSFGAIILLHCYWGAVQTGYIYGSRMSEVIEYWIMGIWLPFGIALFHASNTRFLYVANAQKRYARRDSIDNKKALLRVPRPKTLRQKWKAMDYSNKVLLTVAVGMTLHLTLTLVMFLMSRKFHPSFGIPGTEVTGTPDQMKAAQSKGWEWWPSVFWQIFWAWFVAPYILWQSRSLNDTQGWRTQTICCCIANLHAAPMWLIALYVDAMAPVNKYWIPPQWLAISIFFLEIFTVFIPCYEVLKQQTLSQETLESIQRWEIRQQGSDASGKKSVLSGSTLSSSGRSSWVPRVGHASRAVSTHSSSSEGSILTMNALEHTLNKNPDPLQAFSALRDFSGENIAFLLRVKDWRKRFFPTSATGVKSTKRAATQATNREAFDSALRIYMDFVSVQGAEFQVNLSSQDFRHLEGIFEPIAKALYSRGSSQQPVTDPATPFADVHHSGSETAIVPISAFESEEEEDKDGSSLVNIRYWGDIPQGFNETVWDDAEVSIKYLVLTNTWPKFVKERRSFDSASSARLSRAETMV